VRQALDDEGGEAGGRAAVNAGGGRWQPRLLQAAIQGVGPFRRLGGVRRRLGAPLRGQRRMRRAPRHAELPSAVPGRRVRAGVTPSSARNDFAVCAAVAFENCTARACRLAWAIGHGRRARHPNSAGCHATSWSCAPK
jgi:hypothetical protein